MALVGALHLITNFTRIPVMAGALPLSGITDSMARAHSLLVSGKQYTATARTHLLLAAFAKPTRPACAFATFLIAGTMAVAVASSWAFVRKLTCLAVEAFKASTFSNRAVTGAPLRPIAGVHFIIRV
jgi:hypothetical protein